MLRRKRFIGTIFREGRGGLSGDWRWHVKARNGKKVADSAEGYKNQSDCVAMFKALFPRMKFVVKITVE